MHPPVQNCRVDAAEVHVRVEITLHEPARLERWHLAVVSALDLFAEHERSPGGAMIRSGTVIAHTAAELREDEHDHVVRPVVRPEVGHENFETLVQVAPQTGVEGILPRVRVETAM